MRHKLNRSAERRNNNSSSSSSNNKRTQKLSPLHVRNLKKSHLAVELAVEESWKMPSISSLYFSVSEVAKKVIPSFSNELYCACRSPGLWLPGGGLFDEEGGRHVKGGSSVQAAVLTPMPKDAENPRLLSDCRGKPPKRPSGPSSEPPPVPPLPPPVSNCLLRRLSASSKLFPSPEPGGG